MINKEFKNYLMTQAPELTKAVISICITGLIIYKAISHALICYSYKPVKYYFTLLF